MKELTIENLHKTYGTKTLLDGIDLSVYVNLKVSHYINF